MRFPVTAALLLLALSSLAHCKLYPIEYRVPLAGKVPEPGTPWPMPQSIHTTNSQHTLDPSTLLFTSNVLLDCPVMTNALKRYRDLIFNNPSHDKHPQMSLIQRVHVEVEHGVNRVNCDYPEHGADEEYWINVPINQINNSDALIRSKTVWGALRGLETFSQLIFTNQMNHLLINESTVHDFPRYRYRGVMLDSARHFVPMPTILANLDAMAYNKFNVFHWHLVDDQSFPFVSEKFPMIHAKGAYSPRHIYTPQDVQDVIEYARMRGIRVIPELDTPGHTHAMARSNPDLLTPCYGKDGKKFEPNFPLNSEMEILNPMRNETFSFMKDLFAEFRSVFRDDYIHLGMDEVFYACWKSNPEIAKFMKLHGMKTYSDLEQYYVKETIRNVRDVGYKYMVYQDPLDNNVTFFSDSIVVIWKDTNLDSSMDKWQNYIKRISKHRYQMVLSACWYLNYINYPYPGMDWEKYYLCDPRNFDGTDEEKDLVVGGEACIWGEFVDSTNLLSRLWPRASAVAERLWSDANKTQDVDTARHRLDQHRCRMLQRGIPAAPILNGYCGDYEWEMNREVKLADMGDRIRLDKN